MDTNYILYMDADRYKFKNYMMDIMSFVLEIFIELSEAMNTD
jgi:hypothetical protein